ncbi:MAG: phosphoserine phosphatase RsbU/P [Acidobacteriota bacterium]|jgi:serine phosphatase RsbU (regulator of sigma subunit)|nr:phosphoserine phosphatase RsbU/P [Acidobacteriota bacterium]
MPKLHVVPPEGLPFDHSFTGDSLVVGRAADADLTLADPFLSRRHSRFFRVGSTVYVEDLGSRNGTLLNGQQVREPAPVVAGDTIKISGSLLTVLEEVLAGPVIDRDGRDGRDDELFEDGTIFRRASDLLERQGSAEAAQIQGEAGLRRYAERLRLLNEVHQALGRSLSLAELLELILERALDHLHPDRGAILLKDPDGELRPVAIRLAAGIPNLEEMRFSRSLVREVAEKNMAALVLDAWTDARFAEAPSILFSGVRSLIAAPLLAPEGTLGLIVLDSRLQVRQFAEEDLELLVSLAAVAALHLRNLKLALEAEERRRLEEELALARRIQMALLPSQLPQAAGWELHGTNFPSRVVSGDYYEVVERAEGRELVLMIADVSGKGVAASLLTASLQAFSAGPVEDGLPPDEICVRLSRLLYRRTPPEKFATALLAVLEPATGRLRYTNAGHNPGLIVRAGGEVEELGPTGIPLGLLPNAPYRTAEATLGPGDLLVLYTDGIAEAVNPADEEYGLERIRQVCARHRGERCMDLAEALEKDLEGFVRGVPFADDRTIVLARRDARPAD